MVGHGRTALKKKMSNFFYVTTDSIARLKKCQPNHGHRQNNLKKKENNKSNELCIAYSIKLL